MDIMVAKLTHYCFQRCKITKKSLTEQIIINDAINNPAQISSSAFYLKPSYWLSPYIIKNHVSVVAISSFFVILYSKEFICDKSKHS
ncbi:MAG: hypothetical protein KBT10_07585 [Bacteroidales bacterium]|nr:hypothetical protein [Candidatus Sodaliphilus aphodohippi]